jgi:hypothetical protein
MVSYNDALAGVGPLIELHDCLKGVAANHQDANTRHQFVIAMRLPAVWGEEVELAIAPSYESVNTRSHEHCADKCNGR